MSEAAGSATGDLTGTAPGATGTPNVDPAAAAAAAAPAATDWTTGLNDDLKGYVQNKGFKDTANVVESYRNFEKLLGAKDKLLKLPDNPEDKEAMVKIYEQLGRPQKAEEYKLEVPEGEDPEFAKWASQQFHELGLSRKQGETLVQKWNEFIGGKVKATTEAGVLTLKQEADALKTEWGAAFDQNMTIARKGAQVMGLDAETLSKVEDALGYKGLMKLSHSLGQKVGEATFVDTSSKGGFGDKLTPEQARNQMNALKKDTDFVRRYTSGDAAARREMDRLQEFAFAGQG